MVLGDCDRGYGIPAYPACSGNGICVSATNKCICNKGWSSLADFQVKDGVDCDIHLPTIFSFACISLASSFFGAAVCLTALYLTGRPRRNGSYSKQIKIIAFLLNFLGIILQSVFKIYDTENHVIGSSPGSAVGFFMFTLGTCVGYSYFIEELVSFLHKSCRFIEEGNSSIGLDTKLNFVKRFSIVVPSVGFIGAIFVILAQADPTNGDSYVIVFMGTLLTVLVLNCLLLLSVLPLFAEEMSKLITARPDSPENVRIKEIHYDLCLNRKLIKIFLIMIAPQTIIFMSWNFMRRKYTYLLWFTLISSPTVTSVVCLSFIPKSSRVTPSQHAPNSNPAVAPSARYSAVISKVRPTPL